MKLNVDLTQTPDKIQNVPAGEYFCNIDSVELAEPKGKQKERYAFTFSVSEGQFSGRKIFDNFPVEFLAQQDHPATIRFKHLVKSAGITISTDGVDTDELVGKTVRLTVVHRTYKDDSGTMQEASNVKDYIS